MIDKSVCVNRLKVVRSEYCLSQDRLAEKAGVSRNTISSIERGSIPSVHIALKLCLALKCNIEDVFILM